MPSKATNERDADFLHRAIELAIGNVALHRGPFGALVVDGDQVLAEGSNEVTASWDPTAHAEIVAIRGACARRRGERWLIGCTLFASCEPCPMCLSACYWADVGRVVFAATRHDAEAAGFRDRIMYDELCQPSGRLSTLVHVSAQDAREPFRLWLADPQREPYGQV